MKKSIFLLVSLIFSMTLSFAQDQPPQGPRPPRPQGPRKTTFALEEVGIHDPVMAKEDGVYYLFATGMGVSVMSSDDGMKTWNIIDPVFGQTPEWTKEALPGFRGHMWAPDIIYHNGLWHIFYACSAFAKNTSVIGHATNKTLNPKSPDYKWEDQGCVIQSVPNRDMWNAIDPNVVIDEDGTPWMNFGSFWDGIKLFKMSDDMNSPASPEEWYSISRRERSFDLADADPGDGAVEAPFIMKHGGYYYLFVSFDYCCRGANSTYNVVVGRSDKVQGPYLDKDGKDMFMGGGSLVIKGNERYAGIGHSSHYDMDGKSYFISHAYDNEENGASKLIIREMKWSEDGWPIVEW